MIDGHAVDYQADGVVDDADAEDEDDKDEMAPVPPVMREMEPAVVDQAL